MKKSIIIESITILFIILFLYTGISKVLDNSVFKQQIATSPLLAYIANPIAILLPLVEFLTTLFLIVPRWRVRGLYISLALMVLFTCYVIGILLLNKELPCSCGGVIEQLSWPQHIIFNSAFIILAVFAIVLARKIKIEEREQLSFISKALHS